jgi:uncharacterized membrane protein
MTKTRMEAFSDGVLAIIITIMVLELKIPEHAGWDALFSLLPVIISYILSFIVVGIYWGNHHHLLHTVGHVNSSMIWANLHLLFWLSLIPFATGWMGRNNFALNTVVLYAVLLDMCGLAYFILLKIIENGHPRNNALLIPLKKQSQKGVLSCIAYTLAIPAAYISPFISAILFALVAIIWWVPDRNIERAETTVLPSKKELEKLT